MISKSYIYILILDDKTAFNIGKSDNPKQRLVTLQKYYTFDLDESYMIECNSSNDAYTLESILHKAFNESRILLEYDGGTEFFSYNQLQFVIDMCDIFIKKNNLLKSTFKNLECNNILDIDNCQIIINKLSNAIKRKRIYLNLTQDEMSNHVGISRVSYMKAEKGNTKVSTLIKILDILNLTSIFDNIFEDTMENDVVQKLK